MNLYRYREFKSDEINIYAPKTRKEMKMEQWKVEAFEGMLRPSSPLFFNDPYDCTFCFQPEAVINIVERQRYIKSLQKVLKLSQKEKNIIRGSKSAEEALRKIFKTHNISFSPEWWNSFAEIGEESSIKITENVKVVCLSELYDSVLMWSHYAKNHTGFCIEYNFDERDVFYEHLYQVVYTNDRYAVHDTDLKSNNPDWIYKAICQKADAWSYEKEWRIVIPNYNVVRSQVLEQPKNQVALNVKNNIKAFYLGSKISDEHKNEIIQFGKANATPVYQMVLSSKSYELKAQQIV